MSKKIDLHVHTDFSDGALTPTEVINRYKKLQYDIIAITDHDGIGGIAEALAAAEGSSLKVIPGIELDTEPTKEFLNECGIKLCYKDGFAEDMKVHVLGYEIDVENEILLAELEDIRVKRHERNLKLIAALNQLGVDISYDELMLNNQKDFIGKPNIARLLVKKGYISKSKEAFEDGKYLESKEARAVVKGKIDTLKGLELIIGAGGTPVLAHPMKIKGIGARGTQEFFNNVENFIVALKKHGLKGIECYHADHSNEEALKMVAIAQRHGLYITRGSDFHEEG